MLFALYVIICFQLITRGAQGGQQSKSLCMRSSQLKEKSQKIKSEHLFHCGCRQRASSCWWMCVLRRDSTQIKSRNQTGFVHWIGVWNLGWKYNFACRSLNGFHRWDMDDMLRTIKDGLVRVFASFPSSAKIQSCATVEVFSCASSPTLHCSFTLWGLPRNSLFFCS